MGLARTLAFLELTPHAPASGPLASSGPPTAWRPASPHAASRTAGAGYNPAYASCAIEERQQRSRRHCADDQRDEHWELEHHEQGCEDGGDGGDA